jgi:hypothetical protein
MANTQKIKIKLRSGATNYSGILDAGEVFYNTSTTKLYVGDGSKSTDKLPYFLNENTGITVDSKQTISGEKTFSSNVTAKSLIKSGSSNSEVLLGGGGTKPLNELSESGHYHTVTPTGSVSSTFNGTQSTINSTYTPSGDVSVIVKSTNSNNYTPSGDISINTIKPEGIVTAEFQGKSQEVSFDITPSGTITTPKITVEMEQENINTISNVGTSPSLSASYDDKVLTLNFDKGSLPTIAVKNVATEVKSTSVSDLAFVGSATNLSTSIVPTGTIINANFNGSSITPTGSFTGVAEQIDATFTGEKKTAQATYTPQGQITSTFTGDSNIATSEDK